MQKDEIQFTISDQLFFETLLMEIRGKSISYASYKKKKDSEEEENLNKKLTHLEENETPTENDIREIESVKQDLEHFRKVKMEGAAIRSKVNWLNSGEKPTRYFFNLENRNFVNRSVSFLEKVNGDIIEDQKEILSEVVSFYNTLYAQKDVNDIVIEEIIPNRPTLTQEDSISLEGKITYNEAASVLKNMKNNKSPGPDGFSSEFFKFFFIDIGMFYIRSIKGHICRFSIF